MRVLSGFSSVAFLGMLAVSVSAFGETTMTGHVFTSDTSHPQLGEAWRDPSGMVWGDIAKDEQGKVRTMTHSDAIAYCNGVGGDLPSRADFARLGGYMGALSGTEDGYTAQVLPNLSLTYVVNGITYSRLFWSSSISYAPDFIFYFNGRRGGIYHTTAGNADEVSVRCVVGPPSKESAE